MTDTQIIEAFGTHELARLLKVEPFQVSHWKRRGIPFPRRIDVVNLAHHLIADTEAFLRGEGRP